MPGALEALRARYSEVYGEMETLSAVAAPTDEQRSRFRDLDTEITQINADIELHERQAEREQRAAQARAAASGGSSTDHTTGGGQQGSGWQVGDEPQTYGRHSRQSYFRDLGMVAAKRGDYVAAQERLNRHADELRVELPKRREARERRAREAFENAHRTPREQRALERMSKAGVTPFETRAMNRVDGTGGYLIPPLWIVEDYIPYLRAGRQFADLWRGMELPSGTDSINLPRITQGTATGPQAADGSPVNGRDMNDAFVNAKVQTISGQTDIAIQLLDQSPINFDEIILQDLAADYNLQLSGQCFLGSNSAGQIAGIWPGGAIANTNGIYLPNTQNNAGMTWVNGGGGGTFSVNGSVFQAGGQLLSLMARSRLLPPTHHVWHPWVWYYLMTQVDQQGRPLVVPGTPNNTGFNQAAIDTDGPVAEGPVGYYQGLPVVLDPNMPVTFPSSGTNPTISTISNGQFAAVPGSGVFTPLLLGRWDDLFLWEGEMRTRSLDQVLSGNLQVRFQLYNYVASMPNRYQAYSAITTGTGPNTVAAAGSSLSYATLTQFSGTPANSVLNMTGQGF